MQSKWIIESLERANIALSESGKRELATDLSRIAELADEANLRGFFLREADVQLEYLDDISDEAKILATLKGLCDAYKIQDLSVCVMRDPVGHFFERRVITTYPHEWVEKYVDHNYWMVDPIYHQYQQNSMKFYWSSSNESNGIISPLVDEFYKEAVRYNIGPNGVAYFSYRGDHGDYLLSISFGHLINDLKEKLHEDMEIIFDRLILMIFEINEYEITRKTHLNNLQTELLCDIVFGNIEISAPEVRDKIVPIISILGAKNIYQAILMLSKTDIFDFRPPRQEYILHNMK